MPYRPAKYIKSLRSGDLGLLHKREAATQTWEEGAFLTTNSAGDLIEASANPPMAEIEGIGHDEASNDAVAGTSEPGFYPLVRDALYLMTLDDGTATLALAAAHRGQAYGITRDATTGYWYLDTGKRDDLARFEVVRLYDDVGTVQGRVYARPLEV